MDRVKLLLVFGIVLCVFMVACDDDEQCRHSILADANGNPVPIEVCD